MSEPICIIDEIEKSKNYDAVYMTTFNFDVAFFEKYLLHLFLNNNVRFINLFVDSKQLNSALNEQRPSHFGRKYSVSPININGAFHPKVILMIAKDKAKLIVSSANIKLTGYMTNNEVYESFYFDKDHPEFGSMIIDAVRFFMELYELTPAPDKTTKEILKHYSNDAAPTEQNAWILTNINDSILSQLRRTITDEVTEIRIAVPFYDQYLTALRQIKETFRCQNVSLYIQNATSTFPKEYNDKHYVIPKNKINTFETVSWSSGEKASFYHGKVMEIDSLNHKYVLYGSTNCTSSALISTWKNGGNIECDILEVRGLEDQSFFKQFNICEITDFSTMAADNSDTDKSPFYFVYSNVERENVIAHIGYETSINDLEISCNGSKLKYTYGNQYLDVTIPSGLIKEFGAVFELSIHTENNKYRIPCWFINILNLDYFRKNIAAFLPTDIPDEAETERFNDYMQGLLEALFTDEWNEYSLELKAELSSGIIPVSENSEETETVENEQEDTLDFILEKDISDRLVQRNTLFQAAFPISRQFAAKYYDSLLKPEYLKQESNSGSQTLALRNSHAPRKATSSEKRLARFIRRNLKKHFLLTDTSRLTYDYYLNLCGVILYIMHKMKYHEHITDFMPEEESLKIRTFLVELLLDKFKADGANKDLDLLTRVSLMTIIELGTYREQTKDDKAKKMLRTLNETVNIRDTYKQRIKELELRQVIDLDDTFNAVKYVGNLFGYKTLNELKEYLNELYKGYASVYTIQMFSLYRYWQRLLI